MKFRFKELNDGTLVTEYQDVTQEGKKVWRTYDRLSSPLVGLENTSGGNFEYYFYIEKNHRGFCATYHDAIEVLERMDHDHPKFKEYCKIFLNEIGLKHDELIKIKKERQEQEKRNKKTRRYIY